MSLKDRNSESENNRINKWHSRIVDQHERHMRQVSQRNRLSSEQSLAKRSIRELKTVD